jgi:hypothetical protein
LGDDRVDAALLERSRLGQTVVALDTMKARG